LAFIEGFIMASETENTVPDDTLVAVLPLRDVVIYPGMAIPLFVGRNKSIVALDSATESGQPILLVAQKDAELDEPGLRDLYEVGTLSTILQLLKLPDGTVKALIKGNTRCRVEEYQSADTHYLARVTPFED
jgi:ATP-dependent Lon protease